MKIEMKKIFLIIWIIVTILIVGEIYTSLEITNSYFKYLSILIFIYGIINFVSYKISWLRRKSFMISLIVFGVILLTKFFTDFRGEWKTQTIILQNRENINRTIEFQLQDKGALGFNRRTIDRTKIIPFLSLINEIKESDLIEFDKLKWNAVNIDINGQNFKGE